MSMTTIVFHRISACNPTGKLPNIITIKVPSEGDTYTVHHIHYPTYTHKDSAKQHPKSTLARLLATYRGMKDLTEFK